MESEILKLALSQGLWAVLFVVLLFYILKKQERRDLKSEQREEKYQNIISELTQKLGIVDTISNKIDKVETKIEEMLKR